MPWQRRRGRDYFYKSVRINGKAVKQYVGTGAKGQQAATEVEERRLARQAGRDAVSRDRERVEAAEHALRVLHALAGLLLQATLLAAGYHRHHGEWRLRHVA